jgi:signal transduction histidine kinase
LILIVASSIGFFAIKTTERIQYQRLDDRLSITATELQNTKDDPLTLASLLSDESNLKFSVAYLSAERDLTTINETSADLQKAPSEAELKIALNKSINLSDESNVRARAIALPDNQFIVLSISTSEITQTTNQIIKYLVLFTLFMVLLSVLTSIILFRRDNELNKLVSALQKNHQKMQNFIGDASHELRTPLTVIKGYFELIRKKQSINEQLDVQQLDRIDSEVNRMTEIISDLLYITELDQAQEEVNTKIDISELISLQINDLKALQPDRPVTLNIQNDQMIESNKKYLDQIFANIFSNLKRHTPSDSAVEITIKSDSGRIIFIIEDSGPGLPNEFYQDGIQAFQRFDKSRSRQTGGSGLGMTIIRNSIAKVGGKIDLSPSKSGGLKIKITF